jgi:hypothetical protein
MTGFKLTLSRGSGTAIVDSNNNDGLKAYGPERAHALVMENPGLCTANADNFAWMAMVGSLLLIVDPWG